MLIYGLRDPDTNDLRYVGQTRWPAERKRVHYERRTRTLGRGTTAPRRRLDNWLRKLGRQDLLPCFEVLEVVDSLDDLNEAEARWERTLRAAGCDLLNTHPCGVLTLSESSFIGMKEAQRLRRARETPEDRARHGAKVSAALRGRKHSEETKQKQRKPKPPGFGDRVSQDRTAFWELRRQRDPKALCSCGVLGRLRDLAKHDHEIEVAWSLVVPCEDHRPRRQPGSRWTRCERCCTKLGEYGKIKPDN